MGLRVRFNPDIVALLPQKADQGALARYVRAFGGGGLSVILVEGADPRENERAAEEVTAALTTRPTVSLAACRIELPSLDRAVDPLALFRYADPTAMKALEEALTPEGMRARLAETKVLVGKSLALGEMRDYFLADPLRLSELAIRSDAIQSSVRARGDGLFASDDGTAVLVVVKPKGQALRGADARAFTEDVEAILAKARAAHPGVRLDVTGPHAVAAAMETMIRGDITRAGILSFVLASGVFVIVFRRVRALVAIGPPLLLGTLWTAALASLWPTGISAIAMAFSSVVVGVGFDTGVHVYSALLDARREGLSPADAARAARARTMRPVLVAAVIAGLAFASLAFSSVDALVQLGLLSGAGEVLTAVAIVLVTPEVGSWLERSAPPRPVSRAGMRVVHALTATKRRAAVAIVAAIALAAAWAPIGLTVAKSLVAVRPKNLAPLDVEARIFERFGGKSQPWIVLVGDADRDTAMYRADKLAEALASDPDVERVDALTPFVPSVRLQEERLAARDALLEGKAEELSRALVDSGFAAAPFAPAIERFRAPSHPTTDPGAALSSQLAVLGARYLATDEEGVHVALTVQLVERAGARERVEAHVRALDPGASLTGYARLEADLRSALKQDLPRIGAIAAAFVVTLLAASLRRVREVAIAFAVLVVGIGCLLGAMAILRVPLHIYSALVIPVLLGITVDEAMFLLHHARKDAPPGVDPLLSTLEAEGPPVIATALTTSAGFGALALAKYSALADLGLVGAMGSAAGLLVALILVPAGLRLLGRT
ncbi:MAG: MMPL family transporter [Polyangiaceae bacterium]